MWSCAETLNIVTIKVETFPYYDGSQTHQAGPSSIVEDIVTLSHGIAHS